MKNTIRLATIITLVTTLAGAAAAADWSKIRIATEGAYPPFNYVDSNGQLQGFDVDIAHALCAQMDVECELVAQDWDGMIPALIARKYDAIIASMSITEERRKKVDFTAKYYFTPPGLIAPKNTSLTATDPVALEGKTIGTQSSTTHATYLEDKYIGSTVKLYGTQDEANLDLVSGRLDAIMADSVVLGEWLKSPDGQCCKMVGPVDNDPKYFGEGAGVAIRKGEDELRAMLDDAIRAIVANGTYQGINDKYFAFSVY